jgi:hypothetical protein
LTGITVGVVPVPPATFIVPLAVPLLVAVIQTVTFALWLAANVNGSVTPDVVNCGFENVIC